MNDEHRQRGEASEKGAIGAAEGNLGALSKVGCCNARCNGGDAAPLCECGAKRIMPNCMPRTRAAWDMWPAVVVLSAEPQPRPMRTAVNTHMETRRGVPRARALTRHHLCTFR